MLVTVADFFFYVLSNCRWRLYQYTVVGLLSLKLWMCARLQPHSLSFARFSFCNYSFGGTWTYLIDSGFVIPFQELSFSLTLSLIPSPSSHWMVSNSDLSQQRTKFKFETQFTISRTSSLMFFSCFLSHSYANRKNETEEASGREGERRGKIIDRKRKHANAAAM